MAVTVQVRPKKTREIYYPESDGKPMAETDLHRELMYHVIHTLQAHLVNAVAYVSGNLLVYYEEGNPRRSVAPDAFVVFGVEQRRRRTYKIWEEGKGPDLAVEVTSRSTRREDMVDKMALYARLGVQEYFLYDPTADYLRPPLAGYRLTEEAVYQPIEAEPPGQQRGNGHVAAPALISRLLGLRLALDRDGILQFYRLDTGERVLSQFEAEAEQRRQQAVDAQRYAEEEGRRADAEQQKAQDERRRADAEQQKAQDERRRADQMEAENARLRAELERLQDKRT
ncbi:MAG: Uma2 family endonuclease [Chloroflexi bacterium]|nr:Uma2 family endonuclease [Chloroflexota bacterium]